MKALTKEEVTGYLKNNLKDWTEERAGIKREFKFKNFIEAFSFMTAVALEAEKLNHHPDWSNSYNRVNVALTTHSAGGITQNDFDLANRMELAYRSYQAS